MKIVEIILDKCGTLVRVFFGNVENEGNANFEMVDGVIREIGREVPAREFHSNEIRILVACSNHGNSCGLRRVVKS